MLLFDVNALIAAHRPEHPFHTIAKAHLEAVLGTPAPTVTIPDVVWAGFIRICTNPRVFQIPSTLEEIGAFVAAVRGAPGYCHLTPGVNAIEQLLELCVNSHAHGDLVTDAYIATIALNLDATVVTFDRDFRRFDGLRIIDPSQA